VTHADSRIVAQSPLIASHASPIPRLLPCSSSEGPSPPLANRFGLRCTQLLFHFGCCTLRTFATETTGKLASIICVDVGVVLGPRNGCVRKRLLTNSSLFSCRRRSDLVLQNSSSPIEKLITNDSVLALTARTWASQNCMSLIPKTKHAPASGLMSLGNLFILNNMAERVGFEPTLPFRVNTLSKRAPSATRPSLRVA
jgi:hypothetical protein